MANAREFIGKSKNGKSIFIDRDNSHTTLHIIETPNLLELVSEALIEVDVDGQKMAIEMDLGRSIGKTSLLEAPSPDDSDIVYARRKERETFMRFTKGNRSIEFTSYITIILNQSKDVYYLWSAWVGRLAPPTPDSPDARPESREFWANHALAYDSKIIEETSITNKCPW